MTEVRTTYKTKYNWAYYAKCEECGAPSRSPCMNEDDLPTDMCKGRKRRLQGNNDNYVPCIGCGELLKRNAGITTANCGKPLCHNKHWKLSEAKREEKKPKHELKCVDCGIKITRKTEIENPHCGLSDCVKKIEYCDCWYCGNLVRVDEAHVFYGAKTCANQQCIRETYNTQRAIKRQQDKIKKGAQ